MRAREFLKLARDQYPLLAAPALLAMVQYKKPTTIDQQTELENIVDDNGIFREEVCREINKSLEPQDRMLARYLLEQVMLSYRDEIWGVDDNLKLCAYLLFRIGNVEDSLLIWQAKSINFDTFCGLDIQLVIGAGKAETLSYLQALASEDAIKAVEYIKKCDKAGDFDEMDRYREYIKKYFDE
jgi:hypothetical protein